MSKNESTALIVKLAATLCVRHHFTFQLCRVLFCAGAVIGGLGTLVCSYFARLQRKNERALDDVLENDLATAWSTPSIPVQSAAEVLQSAFRYLVSRFMIALHTDYGSLCVSRSHTVTRYFVRRMRKCFERYRFGALLSLAINKHDPLRLGLLATCKFIFSLAPILVVSTYVPVTWSR